MATALPTGELPSFLEVATTPTAVDRSKHWISRHWTLATILAAVALLLWTLAAVEFGHWMAEGFPPLLPHLQEATEHITGMILKWMW